VVDGDGDDGSLREQFDDRFLALHTCERVAGEAVVIPAPWSVLEDDRLGSARSQELEAAGEGGVGETSLPLQQDHLGSRLDPRLVHGVLDLAGHEVVDDRVHEHAVVELLEPGGLAGPDHLGGDPPGSERLHQQARRGAFADCRIGPQDGDPERSDLFDLALEEVQLVDRLAAANVADHGAAGLGGRPELWIFAERLVQAAVHVDSETERFGERRPDLGRQHPAVGGHPQDQVVGLFRKTRHRFAEVRVHGNARRCPIEHLAGVAAGVGSVDDADHLVAIGAADQPVRGLADRRVEVPVADHQRRSVHRPTPRGQLWESLPQDDSNGGLGIAQRSSPSSDHRSG
jgi:hypothetical protein